MDKKYNNTPEDQVGRVESKLVELGEVQGIVCGNFGEVSQALHNLVAELTTSRVRETGPSRGRRGNLRSEQAEQSVAVSSIRRRLGVAMVKGQAFSLLGCLETLGRGTAAVQWQLKEEIRQCSWRECGYWKKGLQGWQQDKGGIFFGLNLQSWTNFSTNVQSNSVQIISLYSRYDPSPMIV